MTAARGIGRGNAARLRASPRCGACTRRGTACAAPAVHGRARCRMHGGAAGSGAPRGNRNALKDGYHSAAARARRRALNAFIRAMTAAVARLERDAAGPVRPWPQARPFGYAGHVHPFGSAGHVHPFGCMGLNCGFSDVPSLERDSRLRGNDGKADRVAAGMTQAPRERDSRLRGNDGDARE